MMQVPLPTDETKQVHEGFNQWLQMGNAEVLQRRHLFRAVESGVSTLVDTLHHLALHQIPQEWTSILQVCSG